MNTATEPTEAVVLREVQPLPVAAPSIWGTSEPGEVVRRATEVATTLKDVVRKQGLLSVISGKEYPKCEAWTLLGTMLGVFPVLVWTRQVEGGWEARVEARTRDGSIVGAAEAQCLKAERNWANRDDFALRSMAQTRATAKCLRMPLGFVMTLGGFEPTPAEEMVADHPAKAAPAAAPAKPAKTLTPEDEKRIQDKCLARMVELVQEHQLQDAATAFFKAQGVILDTEDFTDLPADKAPRTKQAMDNLMSQFNRFVDSGEVPAPADDQVPGAEVEAVPDEWFMDIVVPIPHKGQKRDDYLKSPDTIGSLYQARHGVTEEAQAARQRLWGFVTHFEAKPWVKKDGTKMPPSEVDLKFRDALDEFKAWFEKNHPDEKL